MKTIQTLLVFCCTLQFSFSQCEIGTLIIEETACQHGQFDVIIDFDYAGTSDSFSVVGNGHNYGCFAYDDLPITLIDLAGDCMTEYEFVVADKGDPDCRREGVLGEICCTCRIYDISWDITECDDHEQFEVVVNFLHENTSDSFSISFQGNVLDCWSYNQLPITIGPFDGDCDTRYGFLIRDKEDPDCLEDFGIGEVCCEEECEIYDVEVEAIECNGDSCMVVELNFLYGGTGTMGFDVYGRNGLIGNYQYNQLPLTIDCFPLSGHSVEIVEICDREFPDCCGRREFEALTCDSSCHIYDLIVEAFDCDSSGNFLIEFDFEYDNVSDSFKLEANGHLVGTYSYDSLALVAGPFEGGCDSRIVFAVYDCLDSLCADTVVLEGTCCEEQECRIYEIQYELTECDSNNNFFVELNFLHEGTSDSFCIERNGHVIGSYAYTDLWVRFGPFEGDCDTEYGFLIRDKGDPHCLEDFGIGRVCCEEECDLYELEYEVTECDSNNHFEVVIDFLYEGVSDSFSVMGNGHNYGCFAYGDLPITLGPLEGDCHTSYEFVIRDKENEHCAIDFGIGEICCEEECRIYDIIYELTMCDTNGHFFVELNFLHEGTSDSFCIERNGHIIGSYSYSDLWVRFGPFEGDCDTEYGFVIRDKENRDCLEDFGIGRVCCNECELRELVVEPFDCDSNRTFLLEIDFDHVNTSDSFTVEINGINRGTFSYDSLGIVVGRLEGGCDSRHVIEICDQENSHCCVERVIEGTCCEEECDLYELEYEVTECDSNNHFEVLIDFLYEGVSDSFSVMGNGHNYGCFAYGDLPITLGPLEGDCHTSYEFVIRDKENEHCAIDFGIGEICCEEECRIFEIQYELTECDTNDHFFVELNFQYEGVSDSFCIERNGHVLGSYAYSDLWVRFGPFEGDCDTEYGFVIRDKENRDCLEDFGIGRVCCNECELRELEVEPFDCDSNKTFLLEIDFDHVNTSDSFTVEINGINRGTFSYDSLAIVVGRLEGGCDSRHVIEICDQENPHCCVERVIEGTCCEEECFIGELNVEAIECNGDSCIVVELDFDHSGTGEKFNVFDRNGRVGTYSYGALPLTIECYPISGLDFEFIRVCDEEMERCCAVAEFEGLDCITSTEDQLKELGWTISHSTSQSWLRFEAVDSAPDLEIRMFGISGDHVDQYHIKGTTQIDLTEWKSGVYIIQIVSSELVGQLTIVKI